MAQVDGKDGGASQADAPHEEAWTIRERDALRVRRQKAGLAEVPDGGSDDDRWGLALSGGGIRSATFCLGLIRGLASNRLLRRFDYLSTVSGGGYVGSSLGRLFGEGVSPDAIERGIGNERSLWLWWLRTNGRYLTPSGVHDLAQAGVSIARGVVATQLELGILLILLSSMLVLPHMAVLLWPGAARIASEHWAPFSAWLLLAPLPFLYGARALFGYWLSRVRPVRGGAPVLVFYGLALSVFTLCMAGLGVLLHFLPPQLVEPIADMPVWLRLWFGLLLLAAAWAMFGAIADMRGIASAASAGDGEEYELRRRRQRYTKSLLHATVVLLMVVGVAVVDRVSWELVTLADGRGAGWVYGAAGFAALGLVLCRAIQPVLQDWKAKNPGRQINLERVLRVLVFGLLVVIVLGWATLVHALVLPEAFLQLNGEHGWHAGLYPLLMWLGLFASALLFVWRTGASHEIVNMASLHGFYRARIERTYVSSGNAGDAGSRFPMHPAADMDDGLPRVPPPDQVVPGDDVRMSSYAPQASGGPIHLVNCCINQTVDDGTRYFNGDRKGVALALSSLNTVEVGPSGPETPAVELGFLSKWIAISGAAAASGMGAMTSPAYSALLFLSGMRLGYWEPCLSRDHHGRVVDAPEAVRRAPGLIGRLPVKVSAIASELFGQFPGLSHRAWYVSDGGHFENTGVYALIKRRLPLVVVADCGADPKYLFEDLESLVRKVRIDFGAEIQFIAPAQIEEKDAPDLWPLLGTPESIGPEPSNACLLVGRIRYRDGKIGALLVVKPRRLENLPFDVVAYADRHAAYPQQSTGDQFFDEAQWESYQRLGLLIGRHLTPALIAQAQAVVRSETCALSSLSDASTARKQQGTTRRDRMRPTITATAAGTGLGLSLMLAVWQGVGEYREQRQVEIDRIVAGGKALAEAFDAGHVPPGAASALTSLRRHRIDGVGSYAVVREALDACDRREVVDCARLKLELARIEANAERDYWLVPRGRAMDALREAELRLVMLSAPAGVVASASAVGNGKGRVHGQQDDVLRPGAQAGGQAGGQSSKPSQADGGEAAPGSDLDVDRDVAVSGSTAAVKTTAIQMPAGQTTQASVSATEQRSLVTTRVPVFSSATKSASADDNACAGRRIFVHIYDEASRAGARCLSAKIASSLGQSPIGIENVVATALRKGNPSPNVWRRPAVLYAEAQADEVAACALGVFELMPEDKLIRALRQRTGRDVIEVWLPPHYDDCATTAE
ncbi:MAG: hypothetical protein JNM58_15480 [Xanthomonadaceae bacterium]|nr:hypothetical protein [Xanthomonadaceae bacterium]